MLLCLCTSIDNNDFRVGDFSFFLAQYFPSHGIHGKWIIYLTIYSSQISSIDLFTCVKILNVKIVKIVLKFNIRLVLKLNKNNFTPPTHMRLKIDPSWIKKIKFSLKPTKKLAAIFHSLTLSLFYSLTMCVRKCVFCLFHKYLFFSFS